MGRVTAAWAILDFELDMTICTFAQTPQFLGVCVTSQIQSTPGKLAARSALIRVPVKTEISQPGCDVRAYLAGRPFPFG
jgi:hypothetical protein